MKSLIFTVTNDLCFDQRMDRICNSLSDAGYRVSLVGIRARHSPPLQPKKYKQKRIAPFFRKGAGFYAIYNTGLFFYLLFRKADAICCIDMDTMLPVWLASKIKNTKKLYDAHEYFSQQKEVISRLYIHRFWYCLEKKFIPHFINGYTVSEGIAEAFKKNYGVQYEVIRNLPILKPLHTHQPAPEKIILYQGAVNESRGFEFLVPAMKKVDAVLVIYGDGNFMQRVKELIKANNLQDKVLLKGMWLPADLEKITGNAIMGINLVENTGLNQYFSLANKFFDYIHHGLPQVTMNFPEYQKINETFETAVLIDDLSETSVADAINLLLNDRQLHDRLVQNCLRAREVLNWQEEEKKLLRFYEQLFESEGYK